jgi:hypothetical protein
MLSSPRKLVTFGGCVASGVLLVALSGVAPALAAPTVTVRVEGESATLLAATTVTLNTPEPVSGCPANSVAAAINLAVNGNWDHGEANHGGGNFTETILGETHAFTHSSDTWSEWVDYKWGGGICSDLLGNGDEVLMVADHEPAPSYAPTVLPLVVSGVPASVPVGAPFTVQVAAIQTPPGMFAERGEGTPVPAEGATVVGPGAAATTTGASGTATITLASAGNTMLRATKAGDSPSASFVVCAHNGNDGNCGTVAPSAGSPTTSSSGSPAGSQTTASSGTAGVRYSRPHALLARLTGLLDGHVYRRGSAPRLLQGAVEANGALRDVALRLTRRQGPRCAFYDGFTERFRPMRCGAVHGSYFPVGRRASFSYLLPAALTRGRYVLDAQATDAAGNRTTLARYATRLVFYVG